MNAETNTEEPTVTEPVRCPDCGARFSYQDLVFGHSHDSLTRTDNEPA
jgi:hypothetical protein